MPLGRFICLEGIEGTGKSTHAPFVADHLASVLKQSVITTREPGGTPLSESIRQLLLAAKKHSSSMTHEAELLLLFAARHQHIKELIQPALQKGLWVVCDRFTETTYAYQGGGRQIPLNFIQALESYVHGDLAIDRVILFDMPVAAAFERIHKKRLQAQPLDRIERESTTFFERARASYLERAKLYKERYRLIEADRPVEEVQIQIREVLNELLATTIS